MCSAHHLAGATIESVMVSVSKMINVPFHRISPLMGSDSGNVEEMMDFVKEKLTMPFCQSIIIPYMIFSKNAIVSLRMGVCLTIYEGEE